MVRRCSSLSNSKVIISKHFCTFLIISRMLSNGRITFISSFIASLIQTRWLFSHTHGSLPDVCGDMFNCQLVPMSFPILTLRIDIWFILLYKITETREICQKTGTLLQHARPQVRDITCIQLPTFIRQRNSRKFL